MNLNEANEYARKMFSTKWVRWFHESLQPAKTAEEKSANVKLGKITNHCAICRNLHGCCFVKDKCPTLPLHRSCHCGPREVKYVEVKADSPKVKFSDYVFVAKNGKKELFTAWGYDTIDSEDLANIYKEQAELAYSVGDYVLGKLNEYGQRISIEITLTRRDNGKKVTFMSGWMVYPDGEISLATPYGGKKK